MTGDQLRQIREERGLTREAMASELGDCTASTINKWERNINPVPEWVEDKVLRNVKMTFPLEELEALLNYARKHNKSFTQIMGDAIRAHIGVTRHDTPSQPYNVLPLPSQVAGLKVAEDESKKPGTTEISLEASDEDTTLVNAALASKRARKVLAEEGRKGNV